MIYRAIGKLVVRSVWLFLRERHARPMKVGAGLAALVVGAALYLASRNVPEG